MIGQLVSAGWVDPLYLRKCALPSPGRMHRRATRKHGETGADCSDFATRQMRSAMAPDVHKRDLSGGRGNMDQLGNTPSPFNAWEWLWILLPPV